VGSNPFGVLTGDEISIPLEEHLVNPFLHISVKKVEISIKGSK
jgi:hypothetical protein